MNYQHIAARALNSPLLLEPGYARFFYAGLQAHLRITALTDTGGTTLSDGGLKTLAASYQSKPRDGRAYLVKDGIAVIPIEGTLVHKSGYVNSSSGMMGYDGVAAQVEAALNDFEVRGILLDIDSPGGEVSGVQALAEMLNNSTKPVWSHANETAASAAYWLASAVDKLVLSETASVGSIGTLIAHADYSAQMAQEGVKVTLVYSGAHKADGNPYGALPDSVRSELQGRADSLRELFAGNVAKNRKMSLESVMATEARMYRGQAAVDAGLADKVMSFNDALRSFSATLAKTTGVFLKGKTMSKSMDTTSPHSEGITPEAHAQAITAATAEGYTQGLQAGATQATNRIKSILTSEVAKGREATAMGFAIDSDMSAEAACRLLATVPVATSAMSLASQTLAQMSAVQAVGSVPDHKPANDLRAKVAAYLLKE